MPTNNEPKQEETLYTVTTAAAKCNVSRIYISKAIEREQLTATLVGSVYVIKESDLLKWDASRKRRNRKLGT